MFKTRLVAAVVLLQAIVLFGLGIYLIRYAESLMQILIFLVGEERALGGDNVIRREDGTVFLTNPVGMIRWMMPFVLLGLVQVAASTTLVWLWVRGLPPRHVGRENAKITSPGLTEPLAGPIAESS